MADRLTFAKDVFAVPSAQEDAAVGRTGLEVAVLGFGCGAVAGLMVRGAPRDQERAVARAAEIGINYFDTVASYGTGESENNLGRVLAALKPYVDVGTKFGVPAAEPSKLFDLVGDRATQALTSHCCSPDCQERKGASPDQSRLISSR